ncbi:glycosyltransferase family 2 protein [Nocardia rhamnosiphila]
MDKKTGTTNDIVIGAASGYAWEDIEAWAMSLIMSGFEGIRTLILYDGHEDNEKITDLLRSNGFRVIRRDQSDGIYNGRFADIATVLSKLEEPTRYAVVTDVRDVYFQSDPVAWLEKSLTKSLLAVSEGVKYSDEPWNRDNLRNGFPDHAARILPKTVCNVGVIAGDVQVVADVCLAISMFAKSSGFDVADQSAYNLLLDIEPYRSIVQIAQSEDGFGCQAGTMADPGNILKSVLLEPQPILDPEGVKTASGKLYAIVHQYDRVSEWDRTLRRLLEPQILRSCLTYLASTAGSASPSSGADSALRRHSDTGKPRVSLVCPTYQRSSFLREAIRHFFAQNYDGGLEMVILDDSPEPDHGLTDPKYVEMGIRYYHMPLKRLTMGTKMNLLTQLATGDILIQYDDADYYAPNYVERMVEFLGDADFLTLSGWFVYSMEHRSLFYWQADITSPEHFIVEPTGPIRSVSTLDWDPSWTTGNTWGYEFSYVWRKSVFPAVTIPDIPDEGLNWDYDFYLRLERAGLETVCKPDTEGIVLHILHHQRSVCQVPQWILPEFVTNRLFPGFRGSKERDSPQLTE